MKMCIKCKAEKDESEFFFRNKSKSILHNTCKSCKRDMDKKSYKSSSKRRSKLRANALEAIERNRTFVRRLKKKLSCQKCGEKRHYVLDFHHLADKKFTVTELAGRGCSLETLKKEIRKCTPLCANCHREEHYLTGKVAEMD